MVTLQLGILNLTQNDCFADLVWVTILFSIIFASISGNSTEDTVFNWESCINVLTHQICVLRITNSQFIIKTVFLD